MSKSALVSSLLRANAENTKDIALTVEGILNNFTLVSNVSNMDGLEYLNNAISLLDNNLVSLIDERKQILELMKEDIQVAQNEIEIKRKEQEFKEIFANANRVAADTETIQETRTKVNYVGNDNFEIFNNDSIELIFPVGINKLCSIDDIINSDELKNTFKPFKRGKSMDIARTAEETRTILTGLNKPFSPRFLHDFLLLIGLAEPTETNLSAPTPFIFYNLRGYKAFDDRLEKIKHGTFMFN